MSSKPFNRNLLMQRRKRAFKQGCDDFLLKHIENDAEERLAIIARDFTQRAVFTPYQEREKEDYRVESPVSLVLSLLNLQHVNDMQSVLAQMKACLKPDGFFLGALIGGQTLNELHFALTQAETEITGGLTPHIHPFIDVKTFGALLSYAGFALPVVDSDILTLRYASPLKLLADLRKMGATNVLNMRANKFLRRDILARACQIYIENFSDSDGRVRATFEVLWVSGWQPHDNQQKPLKRGSATHKLADFL